MLQTNIKLNFRKHKPSEKLCYDYQSYHNNDSIIEISIIEFVRAHYNQDYSKWNSDQFIESHESYQKMIDEAIKNNNLDALEILWQGIYFHDRDNPNYENDVYVAVEHSNIKTLLHVLYGYMKYNTLDGVEPLKYYKLVELASKNKNDNVKNFINDLKCVTTNNEIHYLMTDFDSSESTDEDQINKQKLFLEIINKY